MNRRFQHVLAAAAAGVVGAAHAEPVRADDVAGAVVRAQAGVLNLRSGDVRVAALANMLDGDEDLRPLRRAVIMLDGPLDPARRARLAEAGVRTLGYLPLNAFMADLSGTTAARLRGLGFVTWAGAYRPEWRIETSLTNGGRARIYESEDRRALAARGVLLVDLWLFGDAQARPTEDAIAAKGGRVLGRGRVGSMWNLIAEVPAARAGELSAIEDLQWAEEAGEYSARSSTVLRAFVQSGTFSGTPFYDRGITGAGQIGGLIDGWLGVGHCSFADPANPIGPRHRKILAYNTTQSYDGHGTHVGGIFLGDGGVPDDTRGVAFGAKVVFNTWPDATEPSMYERHFVHYTQGARVHNNSWGDSFLTAYDGPCRALDAFQHDLDDNLIVFAVTNGTQLRNPENAKNVLAVSAGYLPNQQELFCYGGEGPTTDGRRKPEILAPGCNIAAAVSPSGCATVVRSGTSMAAPAVSGTAILLRQYFMDGFYPSGARNIADSFVPSGSLLKSMLVNSAVDVTGVDGFPSTREGWGRLLADNAAYFAGDARRLIVRDVRNAAANALETAGESLVPFEVASAGHSLKITLAWADAAAAANSTFAPINDLNLVVEGPGGVTYRGNNFANGVSALGGSADTINNLEQVLIASPAPGSWRVRVVGAAVNEGPQGFALVVTGDVTGQRCLADFDRNGGVTIEDLLDYVDAFGRGDISADVGADGGVAIEDLLLFLERFDVGC